MELFERKENKTLKSFKYEKIDINNTIIDFRYRKSKSGHYKLLKFCDLLLENGYKIIFQTFPTTPSRLFTNYGVPFVEKEYIKEKQNKNFIKIQPVKNWCDIEGMKLNKEEVSNARLYILERKLAAAENKILKEVIKQGPYLIAVDQEV